jgi:arylsulfatase A-like enzyme
MLQKKKSHRLRPKAAAIGSRFALALAGAWLLLTCGIDKPRPNLIIVLVDTLRADHLSYHGYDRETSPHLDRFAGESLTFLNHYAHASRTGPSVASLFTGLYPRSHGVLNPLEARDAKGILSEEQTTLAEILASHGYSSHGIVTNVNVSSRFGFGQGFASYTSLERGSRIDIADLDLAPPFFLYLHYMEPHSPYNAPEPFRSVWIDPDYEGPVTGRHRQLDHIVAGELVPNAEDQSQLTALYDQEIRYFDYQFAKLLETLESRALLDNTILLVTADHGEELFDHGSVLHGYTLYEEQLHVPFILRDPRIENPMRVSAITRQVDVLPTLLELMGVSYDGTLQGRSLVPQIDGEAGDPTGDSGVFAQTRLNAVKKVKSRSLLADGWKLIVSDLPEPGHELYHIPTDPEEQHNVASSNAAMTKKMRRRLRDLVQSLPLATEEQVDLTNEEKEELRSLGYIR